MKPVKMNLVKNMLTAMDIKYQKRKSGLSAKKDGIIIEFDDGSFDNFVVYKSKEPIFGCVTDNGKDYIFESFAGDFKFSKKEVDSRS